MNVHSKRTAFSKNICHTVGEHLLNNVWPFPLVGQFFIFVDEESSIQENKLARGVPNFFGNSFIMIRSVDFRLA